MSSSEEGEMAFAVLGTHVQAMIAEKMGCWLLCCPTTDVIG